jgi:hypothetical protein
MDSHETPALDEASLSQVKQPCVKYVDPPNQEFLRPHHAFRSKVVALRKWIDKNHERPVAQTEWWLLSGSMMGPSPAATTKWQGVLKLMYLLFPFKQLNRDAVVSLLEIQYPVDVPNEIKTKKGWHDWTSEWRWAVKLETHTYPQDVSSSHWCSRVDIFLHDLPYQLTRGIPWEASESDQVSIEPGEIRSEPDPISGREWDWVRTSRWSSRDVARKKSTKRSVNSWEARFRSRLGNLSYIGDTRRLIAADKIYRQVRPVSPSS